MKNKFAALGISEAMTIRLSENGIVSPTPVQSQAIPVLNAGKDIIAQAQTGTGKTLAFLLPMLEKINTAEGNVQALVITPTRELALQITNEAKKLADVKGVNILAVYGGQDVERQKRHLKSPVHLVIGTPGRILDHVNRKSVNFTKIKMLVLDEADQMLDMGFLRDVEQIIRNCARHRQTILCSATMPKAIVGLSDKYLTNPVEIKLSGNSVTIEKTRQLVVDVSEDKKQESLIALLEEYKPFLAIIFCRTKRRAHVLNSALKELGFASDELHGNLTQGKREQVMRAFREMRTQYLVATDVAARGLDIDGITHVINYDIPRDAETYIHRIGRTGRAGQEGFAISLIARGERAELSLIERGIKTELERRTILTGAAGKSSGDSESPRAAKNSFQQRRPYAADSSSGRTSRGPRKFSGDTRGTNPFGRKSRDTSDSSERNAERYVPGEKRSFAKPGRGSFGDRKSPSFGDRKSSSFGDRKSSSFGDRKSSSFGERKSPSFGERKSPSFGERKSPSFGDRKSSSFGERKSPSFGDKKPGRGGAFKRDIGKSSSAKPFRKSSESGSRSFGEKRGFASSPASSIKRPGKTFVGGRKTSSSRSDSARDFMPFDPRPQRKKSGSGFGDRKPSSYTTGSAGKSKSFVKKPSKKFGR